MRRQNDWQQYDAWHLDWRERPPLISGYSLVLLVIFLGAFVFLAFMAYERPWVDPEPAAMDARTFADRDLEPRPPAEPEAVAQP